MPVPVRRTPGSLATPGSAGSAARINNGSVAGAAAICWVVAVAAGAGVVRDGHTAQAPSRLWPHTRTTLPVMA